MSFESIKDLALPVAAVIIVLGYFMGSWRRGMSDSWKETVDLQAAELATFRESNERLRGELDATKAKLAELVGGFEQLKAENAELRSMVMLDKVPPALVQSLNDSTQMVMADVSQMHAAQVAELTEAFRELLHPVAQGVSRLLTEGGSN